jgi:hypothetical protein
VTEDVSGSDGAAARLATAREEAARARERAAGAARRARELAGGGLPDPDGAAVRAAGARASLVQSLRSSAEAHRRAARTHTGAAALGSGDVDGHRVEAEHHLQLAEADDVRAAQVEDEVQVDPV